MGSRKQAARFGAVLAGAAVAVMATSFPAFATTTGAVDGHNVGGQFVQLDYAKDGKRVGLKAWATLIGVKLGDGVDASTYCVELDVETKMGATMHEAPWAEYPNARSKFQSDRAKVNWILHHSYPTLQLADLGTASHVSGLSENEAIAGTQAAIWHFSNDANLAATERDGKVVGLYKYLTGADNQGIADEPKPTLRIAEDELTGHAGDKIGPFTLETTATGGNITLTGPAGLKILDASGREIPGQTEHQNTSRMAAKETKATFFVQVPRNLAPGSAEIKVDGQATLDEGRLFVGNATQTLIIAKSEVVKVSATSKVSWTAAASGSAPASSSSTAAPTASAATTTSAAVAPVAKSAGLANTGVSIWPALGVAALLLGGGAAAIAVQRKRSRA